MQPELHLNGIPNSVSQKVLAEIWEINVLLRLSSGRDRTLHSSPASVFTLKEFLLSRDRYYCAVLLTRAASQQGCVVAKWLLHQCNMFMSSAPPLSPFAVRTSRLFSFLFRAVRLFMMLFSSAPNLVSSAVVLPRVSYSAHLYVFWPSPQLDNVIILMLRLTTTPRLFRQALQSSYYRYNTQLEVGPSNRAYWRAGNLSSTALHT